jgi:hypothetical protein
MILPDECEGYRFGVGHAELGLKFFKPLSDSHLAQHFSIYAEHGADRGLLILEYH